MLLKLQLMQIKQTSNSQKQTIINALISFQNSSIAADKSYTQQLIIPLKMLKTQLEI